MKDKESHLRLLPAVDEILLGQPVQALMRELPREIVVQAIRKVLETKRQAILKAEGLEQRQGIAWTKSSLEVEIIEEARKLFLPKPRKLVNATGVIIHTNLGRSLLAKEIVPRIVDVACHYSNLEYDLEFGKRGSRYSHVEPILCQLSGAEAALVVNNNAGAVLIGLNTLASGKEVIVSRGELVEIGGAFRMPDIMRQSGVRLVEVGTTNRTHLSDYEDAVTPETALLLKVHTSNYRILGFTSEVEIGDLVRLGRDYGIPVMEDLGSGCLVDLSPYGLDREPTVQEVVDAGVDVVTFSGDKLLGGPQAGIVLGKKEFVARIRKNPLNRVLRIDKLTLSALEGTLSCYLDGKKATQSLPTLQMISIPYEKLRRRAKKILRKVRSNSLNSWEASVKQDHSQVGGGALPLMRIPTAVIAIRSKEEPIERLEQRLRQVEPPIVARIFKEELLLDVRTIQKDEDDYVAGVMNEILK
ncbi:MAG: L-seryl-tRNA(Sec) selenium transferase [Candidatus Aerophobus sp.]|nr:MAG: L-seryl-tRNA(Sec) selenium transferase [Candidatus Aerophobus sp.]